MKPCRECKAEISEQAFACPKCGAPYPAKPMWDGWGYEYKSKETLWGIPLVHVSFKYRPNRMPVPAKGILAIGQFACGVVTVAQFGIGLVTIAQFAVAGWALAQICVGWSILAQIGIYIHSGRGQLVASVSRLLGY
jgi:hypothetical protein